MKIKIVAAALAAFFMFMAIGLTAFATGLNNTSDLGNNTETDMPEENGDRDESEESKNVSAPEIKSAKENQFLQRIFDLSGFLPTTRNTNTQDTNSAPEISSKTEGVQKNVNDTPINLTDYNENLSRQFTPPGTGTVIDQATDSDEKVFYTITAPGDHIFYLVIDKQRNNDNVYFLNAVTVDDLLPLAVNTKLPQDDKETLPSLPAESKLTKNDIARNEKLPAITESKSIEEQPVAQDINTAADQQTTIIYEPTVEQVPGHWHDSNNMGTIAIILIIIILGGGAGLYFKVYRPKKRGSESNGEYEPPADDGDWGNWQDDGDDSSSWDDNRDGE